MKSWLWSVAVLFMVCSVVWGGVKEVAFENAKDLKIFDIAGTVNIDNSKSHTGNSSLKLMPGSSASLKLRNSDGTGKVSFWVYEDGAVPDNPKKGSAGAMWGLKQADGHTLTVGALYAPYLAGATTYATAAFNKEKKELPWHEVQYLGIKRKVGWHQWIFDFDPEKGLSIFFDGKNVNAKRELFNWNKSKLNGFTDVVFFGDATDAKQVLWVDDLDIELGPASSVMTHWPPPPPVPPTDLKVLPPPSDWNSTPYAKWKNGPGKSEDYFPLAVWLQDPKDAKLYKNAGINLYVGLWNGPTEKQLEQLREAGMPVICEQNEYALKHLDDSIIVAWMHGDEPDNAHKFSDYWNHDKNKIKDAWPEAIYKKQNLAVNDYRGYGPPVPPKWIVREYDEIKKNDPTRPIMLNLGQGISWPGYHGRGERTGHLEDYPEYIKGADIVSFDIYPACNPHLDVHNALWYVPQGVCRLRKWGGDDSGRIVWNAMECTEISHSGYKPTVEQVKTEVWMSIIHGSRGIIYFVHKFTKPRSTRMLLEDPEMLAAVTAINKQITELAPVLNSPTIANGATVESSNSKTPIHTMVKRKDGVTYLFAVAMYDEGTKASFKLNGIGNAEAEVLGENRTIKIVNGYFTDNFKGNAVHLYKIK